VEFKAITLSNKGKGGGSIIRDPFRECMENLLSNWNLVDIKPKKLEIHLDKKATRPSHLAAQLE